ncbi:MAG: MBL fold metallo-hydrolase [Candidatus Thalassarchaeaceae archaeon]|nr:MBL fold metallo-hydrolase [Candidatus Thalassarchaeaceae archaeon]
MFELHILGTSSARSAHGRAVSGSFVMTPSGALLVDCGEGMQSRLVNHNIALKNSNLQMRSKMSKVRTILFTHGHLDHSWGLLPMLQTMGLDGRTKPLTIIAPSSQEAITWAKEHPGVTPPPESNCHPTDLAILFQQWRTLGGKDGDFGYPIDWILVPIEQKSPFSSPVQPLDDIELTIVPTNHGIPSCGWQISFVGDKGKFDRAKADELNLSNEQISALASGTDIETSSEKLSASDFRGAMPTPRSLLISGDTTGDVEAFSKLPAPPDILVHEATYLAGNKEKARKWNHSTSHDAARHAQISGTQVLALTHYSSSIIDINEIKVESQELHERSITCLDGDIFTILKNGEVSMVRRQEEWKKYQL